MANVIKVIFINDNHEEFYGSLKAIYTRHTPEEIGLSYGTLSNSQLPRTTRFCIISRHEIIRIPQKNPKSLASKKDNV